ncbi:nicotinate phosphoribosyltransferase family protein [Tritrichomonas foetus]|uniref:Nicotinate phosphoribosyltransferase n=1 Tax=Tritrichomonas foetus TaxID=1144522 RepID=A0A1J4K4Z1_9EUKA|nr:nicotinate phosphoribosyltransferase family protein [Tritrichomonas foetus]|eukprot:OHT06267.1 nicotinate phosphoribosyltransferase family protein [Tritrichomonas foetus]
MTLDNTSASFRSAMLTDYYELTIAYAYFKEGRQDEPSCFDLFYREQPFGGSFAIFAGLNEAISFLSNYKFSEDQLEFIQKSINGECPEFIEYLRQMDMSKLRIYAPLEGSVVFPRAPLLRIEGPLAYCQLIETPLLNAINFPTLMATNALRFKIHVGDRKLMEFGLRRAQGSDGGMSSSKYSYLGLFDCTSNVLAGHLYGIPITGTVAHSFVSSFYDISQIHTTKIKHATTDEMVDLLEYAEIVFKEMNFKPNRAETVAFISQAQSYPANFLALADTYDSIKSGVPNFLGVAYGLHRAGYRAKGVRLDSGNLAELSKQVRQVYRDFAAHFDLPYAADFIISASNDINEKALIRLEETGHEINMFGIGTHLVTCQLQPALGGVYKLVEINGHARVKLSNSFEKITLPFKKMLYRCFDSTGKEIADLLTLSDEEPQPGVLNAFQVYPESKPIKIECARIEKMYNLVWGVGAIPPESLHQARERVLKAYNGFNKEVLAVANEKQYCVAISEKLYEETSKIIDSCRVRK